MKNRQIRNMRIVLLVSILLFSSATFGAPKPSSQGARERVKEQQASANEAQSQTVPDQRGTAIAPLIVQSVPAAKSGEDAAREAQEHDEKSSLDRWLTYSTVALAVCTFLLFFFTALLWWVTYRLSREAKIAGESQSVETRKSLDVSKASVDAAVKSIEVSERTAERQLRAYVGPELWRTEILGDGTIVLSIQYKNFGQTPAHNLHLDDPHTSIRSMNGDVVTEFVSAPAPDGVHRKTLNPGQALVMKCAAKVEDSDRGEIFAMKKYIDVRFRLLYVDAFNVDRVTEVHLVCFGNLNAPEWRYAADGNDAT